MNKVARLAPSVSQIRDMGERRALTSCSVYSTSVRHRSDSRWTRGTIATYSRGVVAVGILGQSIGCGLLSGHRLCPTPEKVDCRPARSETGAAGQFLRRLSLRQDGRVEHENDNESSVQRRYYTVMPYSVKFINFDFLHLYYMTFARFYAVDHSPARTGGGR